MTKDDILNMQAGEEMDTLVAEKVMGWHKYTDMVDGHRYWEKKEGGFACGIGRYPEDDSEFLHTLDFHPSESILWAWEVVEKIKEEFVELVFDRDGDWRVYLCTATNDVAAWADTMPLAICRAALLAMEGE